MAFFTLQMRKTLLWTTLSIMLAGCAANVQVTGFLDISSGKTAPPAGASFAVLENGQAPNPILDNEIKSKIEKLLLRHGYQIMSPVRANYILAFSYGVSPGLRLDPTPSYSPPQAQIIAAPDGKGGTTYTSITAPGVPSGVPAITEIFTKHLTLKVIDAKNSRPEQKENVVWIGETFSADLSSDLRYDIDYLLVAAFEYFGKDTGRQIKAVIDRDAPEVRALRSKTGRQTGSSGNNQK